MNKKGMIKNFPDYDWPEVEIDKERVMFLEKRMYENVRAFFYDVHSRNINALDHWEEMSRIADELFDITHMLTLRADKDKGLKYVNQYLIPKDEQQ